MGKFVKFEGEFRIDDADKNTSEVRKVVREIIQTEQFTTHTLELGPNVSDFPVNFGGLQAGQARKLFISSTAEIAVKINGVSGPSFQLLSTTVIGGRIDSLHISTGMDPANVEIVAAGL